jgi:hypothetical protein
MMIHNGTIHPRAAHGEDHHQAPSRNAVHAYLWAGLSAGSRIPINRWLQLLLVLFSPALSGATAAAAKPVDFGRDIRPILSDNCFSCHGPDEKARKAKLRLDLRDEAIQPAKSGQPAIVPGSPARSTFIERITASDEDDRMPPSKTGKKLTPAQIQLFRTWIEQGASYKEHWAYIRPERPAAPVVKKQGWARNPLDSFVLSRLEEIGLNPAREADRATLLRRVTLDLTGLPPTVAEVDAFLADKDPKAYEKVVERLLKSSHYGEHFARHWLDLARYADTNGYQYDTERSMWRWREWVIDAYNRNLPFDQFTIQQLAGDLLPNPTLEQKIATGFNRNHPITIEGGVIEEEYRTEYVMDRVTTTSTVWLGLTMGCCRCHDHKYDPLTMRDFYGMFAFFNSVAERGFEGSGPSGAFNPRMKAPTARQQEELGSLDERIARLQSQVAAAAPKLQLDPAGMEKALRAEMNAGWTVLDPATFASSGDSKLTRLDDKSILAAGEPPLKETYDITARVEATGITAVRLDALVHESLPQRGPGRFTNGNFVLSDFELEAVSVADPSRKQTIQFASARADYEQSGYLISTVLRGRPRGKGWAVDGNEKHEDRFAVFVAEKPFGFPGGTELRFHIRHQSNVERHSIGRVRLSIASDPSAVAGVEVAAILNTTADKRTPAQQARLQEVYLSAHAPDSMRSQITELIRLRADRTRIDAGIPFTMVMQDLDKPRDTFMLIRGQYDKKSDPATPATPGRLAPMPDTAPKNRLGFARWLVSPENPLTARVAVNRFWEHYFGAGIVRTSEDFGVQSEPPSHPGLLDWMATEFISSGWDMKHIQRLIVTSATYRQSSQVTPDLLQRDPENRLLARGPRQRLSAETIRDNALAISGLLVDKVGGPSVYPYQPDGLWMEINDRKGFSKEYERSQGEGLYRRSLYTFWKRTVPPPTMNLFDAPEREFCVVRRSRTTTPLQALALLHDPTFVEAARHLAERMMTQGGAKTDERIAFGFRAAIARRPRAEELKILRQAFDQQLADFRKDPGAAARLLKIGDSPRNEKLNPAEHAAWTTVARMILNLDEVITKS